jgi:ABC-2 type transport system ATP-binding protein
VNDPDILFLDEPTTGLDPQARRNIWDIILKLKEMRKTTILTTHYMDEAEQLSDRVCIVDQGKIVAMDTSEELIRQLTKERQIQISFTQAEQAIQALQSIAGTLPAATRTEFIEDSLHIWSERTEESLFHLFKHTTELQIGIEQITIRDMTLEDVFIAYTGKEWRD